MDEAELEELYRELVEEYGNWLPDPICEPRRFSYYYKLHKRLKENNKNDVIT